ncbi:uncharacterized protein IAS62_005032 [Cryptococcus decagattii]|uniref:Xylanolytic transcriptional activator regulatory domain-containing protein n=1 Tax=Cryptococcus decagattii TaxID=1859122 RepID=A0ABZ2AYQ8_9TREE
MAVATSGDDNCPNEGGFSPQKVEAQPQSVASTSEHPRASISSLVGSGSELLDQVNVDSNLQDFGSFIYPIWSSGIETQEGTNVGMMQSPKGTSFPTTSHQSPSIPYRLPSHSSSSSTRSRSESDVHGHSQQSYPLNVLQILEQLVPQTVASLDPERPLLRVAQAELADQAGNGLDTTSRFYLPTDRFNGGYQIPHWALPPLRTLSLMAYRTFHTVLNHFSFVHLPTFRLIDTSPCLAFAICTIGGIRTANSSIYDHYLWEPPAGNGRSDPRKATTLDGPVVPIKAGKVYTRKAGITKTDLSESMKSQAGKNALTVRNEKIDMLVKSFYLAKGMLMTEFNVALLQALILYHTPNFLSENERERASSNMFTGTIVNVSRQIGFFTPENDHFNSFIRLPDEPYTPNELNRCWKDWVHLESVRRTAYLVYHLDTISALEANIPCLLSPHELAYIPLPAPDTLWEAPDAETWLKAAKGYRPMTLDEAMRRTFFLPICGTFDQMHEKPDREHFQLSAKWREGWDCDSLCAPPTMTHMNIRSTVTRGESSWSEGSLDAPEEEEMLKTTINYCEDAFPLYWLAQTLQNLLVSDSSQLAGTNIFSNLRYNNMLKAARTFARTREGLPTGASNVFTS